MAFGIPNRSAVAYEHLAREYATDWAIAGDRTLGVISGGDVVAGTNAGTLKINAGFDINANNPVAVAALDNIACAASADGTNPKWALLEVDNAGAATLNVGTAAVDPEPPTATAGRVVHAAIYLPAAATLVDALLNTANGKCKIIDKRTLDTTAAQHADPAFGDGSDGNATLDGTTANPGMIPVGSVHILTRDCYFQDVVITSGAAGITLGGWRMFIRGTLTVQASKTISTNGGTQAGAGAGGGAAGGAASSTAPGTAGGGGVAGGAGAAGATTTGSLGGNGGAGGAATGGGTGGGTAGAVATQVTAVQGGPPHHAHAAVAAGSWGATGLTMVTGGVGGSAGSASAGTGSGGGGGGGGGIAMLAARFIVVAAGVTLTLAANGGNGRTATAGTSVNAGGGAGGGGGVTILVYYAKSTTGTVTQTANGGTGGAPVGTGATGAAGANGTNLTVQV